MASPDQIPTLLSLMFGQSAGTAGRAASPRLLLWAQAFDDWLAERRRLYSKSCVNKALQAWTHLYQHNQAMPWELRPADLAAHLDWMRAQDFAPNTINGDLSSFSLFYRWVAEKRLDPDCEPFFDPAAAVPRLVIRQYEGAVLLSRAEIGSLLDLLQADTSPLGLRERAFTLARLLLGVPFRSLQRLQWGQIQVGEAGASVCWEPESEPIPLPSAVWDAIHACLAGTGRLPVMEPGSYIFAPLADPTAPGAGLDPGDWASSRFLSSQQIRASLRRYGRLAGIPDLKLESHALRRTAIRLRLDSGDSLEKMQSFLGARSQPRLVDYRLSLLPSLPEDPDSPSPESPSDLVLPNRQPHRFQPGDTWIHGLYARSRPAQEIQAVLQEDFQGLEEQIAGLRLLSRGLMERERAAVDRAASARLIDLFSQASGWLSILTNTDEFLSKPGEADDLSRQIDEAVDRILECYGDPPDFVFQDDSGQGEQESVVELSLTDRGMLEEIAALRYYSRNLLVAAVEARDTEEYARMVQHYGRLSVRLARHLRREKANRGQRMFDQLTQAINEAVDDVLKDWKI